MQQVIALNPIYWYITASAARSCGASRWTCGWWKCGGLCALLSMLGGVAVFRRTQDRFVLHI